MHIVFHLCVFLHNQPCLRNSLRGLQMLILNLAEKCGPYCRKNIICSVFYKWYYVYSPSAFYGDWKHRIITFGTLLLRV